MRIVQVLGGAEDGGLEKHTIELCDSLHKEGLDVSVIAHEKFRNDFKNSNFIELDLSKGRNNPFVLYKLYKILKKENFDIIHTQANKATDMVIKLKPYLKSKIISTLHSSKKNIKSFEKADIVITVSDRIGEKLKNKNIVTIYNGIKPENIQKIDLYEKFNIKNGTFILCAVGRLVDVKKFDILIQSIENLDVHLILVGSGEKKKELIDLAKKLKIKNKITFTSEITNQEVKKIIQASDLSIITSQKEGFSYVFAESLVFETPLVSTDVADIKKFIGEKYILPFEDVMKISDAINYVKMYYEKVVYDFKNNIFTKKKEFLIENMVKKTISTYKKALDESSYH